MVVSPLTLNLTLDERSGEAVYQQIAGQLRAAIESGTQAPGSRLPAIRTLANDLGLHRDTIALAYDQLAQWGLVEARVGAGTFVRAGTSVDAARASDGEIDFELAPQVERLIALENTRPRYATG